MFYCSYDPGLAAYLADPDAQPWDEDRMEPVSDLVAGCIAAAYGLIFLVAVVM